jgi:opacity protein-like surface antigen
MIRPAVLALLTLLLGACASEGLKSQVGFGLGLRQFDSDADPAENHLNLGFEYAGRAESGLGFEAGTNVSGGSGTVGPVDVTLMSWELYGGGRYTFDTGSVLPFVNLGVSALYQRAEFETSGLAGTLSFDDTSLALYFGGGLDFPISDRMYLGAQIRRTLGHEFESGGLSADTDSTQYLLRIGWNL